MKWFIIFISLCFFSCRLSDVEVEIKDDYRDIVYGVRLEIGSVVFDSLYPPPNKQGDNNYYSFYIEGICSKLESGTCRSTPRRGQILGWDSTCFNGVVVNPSGCRALEVETDGEGRFDWSDNDKTCWFHGSGQSYSIQPKPKASENCKIDLSYDWVNVSFTYLGK